MVRAAGLYPAGSRFESWLPYHPAHRRPPLREARAALTRTGAVGAAGSEQLADPFDDLVAPLGVQDARGRERREPGRDLLVGDRPRSSACGRSSGRS